MFEFFKEISKIPRGSGNEKGIADYIENFAKERGLFVIHDNVNNVFVRREAAAGKEKLAPIMLQAHTDMVCEKVLGSTHDFLKDPIELIIENGIVRANGTTLGADDGAGVALMLGILDDKSLNMGEIECLFTSSEETGMDGAFGFDYSVIHSEKVINLDSEEELNACIGCAGGMRSNLYLPLENTKVEGKLFRLNVCGLSGGHSGVEIDSGKRSAIKILASALDEIYKLYPFHIVNIQGGGRDNVIPFDSYAVISFYDEENAKNAKELIKDIASKVKETLIKEDKKAFKMTLDKEKEEYSKMLTLKSSSNIISAILLVPQGVTERVPGENIVDASVNMGSMVIENDELKLGFLIRSGRAFYSNQTASKIDRIAHILGGRAEIESSYPGWAYNRGSVLQDAYTKACIKTYGKEPIFTSIHAGLECGLIADALIKNGKHPDIISIGPVLSDIHTPKECMDIGSYERMNELVKLIIGIVQ